MIRELQTMQYVYCRYGSKKTCEECEKCTFFNGLEKNENGDIVGVDCLRSEIPILSNLHISEFTMQGKRYKARYYDEDIDGKIEGDDPYDFCQKCYFNKTMRNGDTYCLLRSGIDDEKLDLLTAFSCYEGEIWEEFPINEDE